MKIALRPHHFLCLKGYKGENYNKLQVINWDKISQKLRNNPETDILIVSGHDELCKKCSCQLNKGVAYCKDQYVNMLDAKVSEVLGITSKQTYKYSEIMKRLKDNMNPQIHEQICKLCSWWKKGLCRDSFKNV